MPNSLTKGEKTKNKIFKIAIKLFKEKGYNNVPVEEIATCANIAKGTFYIYFPSKSHLVAELFEEYDYMYDQKFSEISYYDTSYEKVMAIIKIALSMTNNEIGYDLTRIAYQNQLEFKTKSTDLSRPLYKKLSLIISEGQKNNEFNNLNTADFYTMMIVRNLRGTIYEWCMTQCIFDIEEHGIEYMKNILKFLQ